MRAAIGALLLGLLALLAGCGSAPRQPDASDSAYSRGTAQPARPSKGGYYKDDGPGENAPDIALIENPEPRLEPMHRFANNPYTVDGRNFTPMRSMRPFTQRGMASWYGRRFHGQRTSSGEVYDMYAMTAAHPTLPIPSYAKVTNLQNGRWVVVRVNDRGPFHSDRVIDLSWTAAAKLDYLGSGSAQVELELIQPDDMARYARRSQPLATASAPPSSGRAASSSFSIISAAQAAEPSGPTGLYLQLGAFGARENAESLRQRLVRELSVLKNFIEVLPGEGAYRVRIGPYRSRDDAALDARRLRDVLGFEPFIVAK